MDLLTPGTGLIVWQIITLIAIILPIVSLVSITKRTFRNNDKVVWIIVVLTVPIVGSLCYLLVGKKKPLSNKLKIGCKI